MPKVTADPTRTPPGGRPNGPGNAPALAPRPTRETKRAAGAGPLSSRGGPKPTTPQLTDSQAREFSKRISNVGGSGSWLGGGEGFETWFKKQDQAKFMYALTHYAPENPNYESAPIDLLIGAAQSADGLTFDPRRAKPVADALRDAYTKGYVTAEDLHRVVEKASGTPSRTVERYHGDLGRLVSMTGEMDLVARFAKLELEGSEAGIAGAEEALKGLPPPSATRGVDLLKTFVDSSSPKAVSAMLGFSPKMSIRIFLGEPPDARRGEAVLRRLVGNAGAPEPRDSSRLSWFLGSRLFGGAPVFDAKNFPNREAARVEIVSMMASLRSTMASRSASPSERKRAAILLGTAVGALEGGFEMAFKSAQFAERTNPDEMKRVRQQAASFVDLFPATGSGLGRPPAPSADWIDSSIRRNAPASGSAAGRAPMVPFGALVLDGPKLDATVEEAFESARLSAFRSER